MSMPGSPRFLVIRRDNIGDLVCTLPLIAALRESHPQAYIASLVNSYNRGILDGNPDIDEIFVYTKAKHRGPGKSLLGVIADRIGMLLKLRSRGIDVAILAAPGFQPRSLRLARLAGAGKVLGFVERQGQGSIEIPLPSAEEGQLHEVEAVFRLGAPLGIHGEPPRAAIVANRSLLAAIESRIGAALPARRGPVVGIHISARKPSQRWPAERFAELARTLMTACDARVLLFWSPGDASNALHPGDDDKANRIIGTCGDTALLAVPTERLEDLVAGLAACDLVVCADGGAMHMAAALQKSLVCLFGDSSAVRWHPWRTRYELLQAKSRDVADIEVPKVVSAALNMLGPEHAK